MAYRLVVELDMKSEHEDLKENTGLITTSFLRIGLLCFKNKAKWKASTEKRSVSQRIATPEQANQFLSTFLPRGSIFFRTESILEPFKNQREVKIFKFCMILIPPLKILNSEIIPFAQKL